MMRVNFFQDKDVHKIEDGLNKEFSILCQWVGNRLSKHFGKDEAKWSLLSKFKCSSKLNALNIF